MRRTWICIAFLAACSGDGEDDKTGTPADTDTDTDTDADSDTDADVDADTDTDTDTDTDPGTMLTGHTGSTGDTGTPPEVDRGWFFVHPTPTGSDVLDVHFVSDQVGFALTEAGLLDTIDGSTTWRWRPGIQSLGFVDLTSMVFLDENVGWAVGAEGRIVHTSDGGFSWEDQSPTALPYAYDLKEVAFASATRGMAVGDEGTLLVTDDGGATWTLATHPGGTEDLLSAAFVDEDHGFVGGWWGLLMETTDGGATWTDVSAFPSSETVDRIEPAGSGVVVAASRYVYMWDGTTWEEILYEDDILDMAFSTPGDGHILYETDDEYWFAEWVGGSLDGTSPAPEEAITFYKDGDFLVVGGPEGMLQTSTDDGDTFTGHREALDAVLATQLHDLDLVGDVGVATGRDGLAIVTTDGGETWAVGGEEQPGREFQGVDLRASGVAVTVGWDSNDEVVPAARYSVDSGLTWADAVFPSTATGALHGVAMLDDLNGIAVGDNDLGGMVFTTADGGATWAEAAVPGPSITFRNVQADDGEAMIMGAGGLYYVTTDGGLTYTTHSTGTEKSLKQVEFVDDHGIAVATDVLYTVDGGATWTEVPMPFRVEAVAMHSATDAVVVGMWGRSAVTSDGGATWTETSTGLGASKVPRDVVLRDDGEAIVMGANGSILVSDGGLPWTLP